MIPKDDDAAVGTPGPGRIWAIRFGLALVGALLIVAAGETAGRLYIWYRHGVPGKYYGLWKYDEELGAIHANSSYNTHTQTNNEGFRGREDVFEPKPAGSLRIICYGGSSTYCYNLADGETWAERLQGELRKLPGHEKDQVLNGGHILWSLGHLYRQAKRDIPKLKPDIVVLYVGVNEETNASFLAYGGDDLNALNREKRYGLVATNLDQSRWLKRNSVLCRFFDYRVKAGELPHVGHQAQAAVETGQNEETESRFESKWAWQNYKAVLPQMIALIRQYGGQPIFVVECSSQRMMEKTTIMRYSPKAADMMRAMGVSVTDPRAAFLREGAKQELFYATGVHVTAVGAVVLAKEILGTIQAIMPGGARSIPSEAKAAGTTP